MRPLLEANVDSRFFEDGVVILLRPATPTIAWNGVGARDGFLFLHEAAFAAEAAFVYKRARLEPKNASCIQHVPYTRAQRFVIHCICVVDYFNGPYYVFCTT